MEDIREILNRIRSVNQKRKNKSDKQTSIKFEDFKECYYAYKSDLERGAVWGILGKYLKFAYGNQEKWQKERPCLILATPQKINKDEIIRIAPGTSIKHKNNVKKPVLKASVYKEYPDKNTYFLLYFSETLLQSRLRSFWCKLSSAEKEQLDKIFPA